MSIVGGLDIYRKQLTLTGSTSRTGNGNVAGSFRPTAGGRSRYRGQ
jgi:hypothetical protein